jgi:hypothetical protein
LRITQIENFDRNTRVTVARSLIHRGYKFSTEKLSAASRDIQRNNSVRPV